MAYPFDPLTQHQSHDPSTVFVALGANLPGPFGAADASVAHAMDALAELSDGMLARSPLFRTPAYPAGSGPDFVNAVIAVSAHDPEAFFPKARAIEAQFKRAEERAKGRWMPRSIDVDIIAVGQRIEPSEGHHAKLRTLPQIERTAEPGTLILPHPSMHERAFVLVPMAAIAPHWCHPALNLTAREMADSCAEEDLAAIRVIDDLSTS